MYVNIHIYVLNEIKCGQAIYLFKSYNSCTKFLSSFLVACPALLKHLACFYEHPI